MVAKSGHALLDQDAVDALRSLLLPMATVKSIIFRWVFSYYNNKRVYTSNEGGYPPDVKRQMYYEGLLAAAA
jgi:hypothetical protein